MSSNGILCGIGLSFFAFSYASTARAEIVINNTSSAKICVSYRIEVAFRRTYTRGWDCIGSGGQLRIPSSNDTAVTLTRDGVPWLPSKPGIKTGAYRTLPSDFAYTYDYSGADINVDFNTPAAGTVAGPGPVIGNAFDTRGYVDHPAWWFPAFEAMTITL